MLGNSLKECTTILPPSFVMRDVQGKEGTVPPEGFQQFAQEISLHP
jgi:hypothetical protein